MPRDKARKVEKMPEGGHTKCSKWNPCWVLEKCLKPVNGLKAPAGISMYVLIRFPIDKPMAKRHVGYLFKRDARAQGYLLNFCPFCGENVDFSKEGYEDEPEETAQTTIQDTADVLVAP